MVVVLLQTTAQIGLGVCRIPRKPFLYQRTDSNKTRASRQVDIGEMPLVTMCGSSFGTFKFVE